MKRIELFQDRVFNRKLFGVAFPVTLQSLMLVLVGASDALMLGMVSQNTMAAVSLATQIQFVQHVLLAAIVSGVGILGAQYWGKRDYPKMGEIFALSIQLVLPISVAFLLGCLLIPEKLMLLFAHDPELVSIGVEYLRVASWSYLLNGVSLCYLAIMRVSDHVSRSAWISAGAVILNIGLNAVFIFGWFGIPALGVRGAALATLIARVIELGMCIISSCEKSFIPLKLRALLHFNAALFLDFWRYTLPVLGSTLLWGIGFTSYTAIMGHLGPDAAAANAVAAVARNLAGSLSCGIPAGAGIMIGNELGAGNFARAKIYGQKLVIFAFLAGILSGLVILSSIPLVSSCLRLTEQAHFYMVGMFAILSVYVIGQCVCGTTVSGIFASGGDTLFNVYSLVVCMWGIALPCAFLGAFVFHLPVFLVYACICMDEVGKIPWVMLHFRKYKWVKNITRN